MGIFSKKTWLNRISEYPNRRTLTKTDGSTETVSVARAEGTVSQEGDAFSASNMNNLETRIDEAFENALGGCQIYPSGGNIYAKYGDITKKLGSSEGSATSEQVLAGATFNSANTKDTEDVSVGTMTNKAGTTQVGSKTQDSSNVILTIPVKGYYDTSSKLTTPISGVNKTLTITVTARLNPEGSQYCGEATVNINGTNYHVATNNSNSDVSKTQSWTITV